MERLTYKSENDGHHYLKDGVWVRGFDKLAAYEDTGFEPEEVKLLNDQVENRFLLWVEKNYGISGGRLLELVKAEEQERLVVLPCKKGVNLFVITCDSPTGIEETKCNRVSVDRSGTAHIFAKCVYDYWGGAYREFKTTDFGKTVFLTRQEAEKTLEGME